MIQRVDKIRLVASSCALNVNCSWKQNIRKFISIYVEISSVFFFTHIVWKKTQTMHLSYIKSSQIRRKTTFQLRNLKYKLKGIECISALLLCNATVFSFFFCIFLLNSLFTIRSNLTIRILYTMYFGFSLICKQQIYDSTSS